MTALMAAALYGDASLVKRVLDAGGNPNARTVSGVTALMMAVPALDATRLLLEAGADVNAHSDDGRTALLITAGTSGARATLKLLLDTAQIRSPGSRRKSRRCAKRHASTTLRCLRSWWRWFGTEKPGRAGRHVPARELRRLCVATRRRRTDGQATTRIEREQHATSRRPRSIDPVDDGCREEREPGSDPCGSGPQLAAATAD